MKNAVPKNDKKKRKQLTEDIAKLEEGLNQKHEEELRQLSSDTKVNVVNTQFSRNIKIFGHLLKNVDLVHDDAVTS